MTRRRTYRLSLTIGIAVIALLFVWAAVQVAQGVHFLAAAGIGEQQRYLVLAQNPAELRPAGGYTGTVGTIALTNGRLTESSFADVYKYDLQSGVEFVEPPEELANHLLGAGSWQLADAAWSPDFPTGAQDALHAYTLESGDEDIDGVIALTTYAVDRLLSVTGPIEVPEYGVTVASGDVTLSALRLTRGVSTPTSDRKAFLELLGNRTLDRLSSLSPTEWPRLVEAFAEMGDRREVLVWFKDPRLQAAVAGKALGGAVCQDPGDYLFVVEANVSPTSKYNLVVSRRDTLRVQIDGSGTATTDLVLDWQNDSMLPGEPYESIRSYSKSKVGQYGAYVRVLTPETTTLVDADGVATNDVDGAETVEVEAGRNVFGGYLLMSPGPSSMHYRWSLPDGARVADGLWTYEITLQKQSGVAQVPTSVSVTLPAGASVESLSTGAQSANGVVTFTTDMATDAKLRVTYRL